MRRTKENFPDCHFLNELRGIHKGQTGFVVGNGESSKYYDTRKMKAEGGVLIGCNQGFKLHPLDYLTFQDSQVVPMCFQAFKGIRLALMRDIRNNHADYEKTYYYSTGKDDLLEGSGNSIRLMDSGSMAFQAAILMGLNPIILVGCDGCFIVDEDGGFSSNRFRDKQVGKRNPYIYVDGKPTTKDLRTFSRHFEQIYLEYVERGVDVYQLGDWSIVGSIPRIEYEDFWSDLHPGRDKVHHAIEQPKEGD